MATGLVEQACYGPYIQHVRREAKLSRAAAASGGQISVAMLQRHERHQTGPLNQAEIPLVAVAVGLDPAFLADLFVRNENWTPPSGWGRP